MNTKRAFGRVFLFGKQQELRNRAISHASIGGVDPDWDDLLGAELEVRQPAARQTFAHGSPGEGEYSARSGKGE
jgi:hypothetical protein